MRRWPIIRHCRFWYHAWRYRQYWEGFAKHYWLIPNPADLDYLEAIWKGEA